MKYKNFLVPRLMDADNFNPQNNNAQNILSHWLDDEFQISTLCYNTPRQDIVRKQSVHLIKLWRWRFWRLSAWLVYQRKIDVIFYPGADISDDLGWRFRDFTGRKVPIVATLEGLLGNPEREKEYSAWAGHQVYCQQVDEKVLARIDRLYERADHIIAISPFLADMGKRRYGNKFSVLPLGVDSSVFFADDIVRNERMTVIGAGRLYANKRPEVFVELASKFPNVDFIWYGWGEMRDELQKTAADRQLKNLIFPGPVGPEELADAMRRAHLFVLPSYSEGVPKVTQEAAACGLPIVIFGYYEAPTVEHENNGYVVWDDDQLIQAVSKLLENREMALELGLQSRLMAQQWPWEIVASRWFKQVKNSGVYN